MPDFDEAIAWYTKTLDFRLLRSISVGKLTFGFISLAAPPLRNSSAAESKSSASLTTSRHWNYALRSFRRLGRGLLVTRDHMDLGSSICALAGVGKAHHFHTRNMDPVEDNRRIDDPFTTQIGWPNYHSGANGDFQIVAPVPPLHPVLVDPDSPTGEVRFLPCHPHEGSVAAPEDEDARVIATGVSQTTGRPFNLAVAFEATIGMGRAIAQSTFHHFADYNWDPSAGALSFVDEPPGDGMIRSPEAAVSTHRYILNVAIWLANREASLR